MSEKAVSVMTPQEMEDEIEYLRPALDHANAECERLRAELVKASHKIEFARAALLEGGFPLTAHRMDHYGEEGEAR